MTIEELIQGHLDGTLAPAQEQALAERLGGSADARGMLEGQRQVDALLAQDAATLAPSAALDEAVIAASLSALPESVAGGGGLWLGAKIAAGLVVAGALGVGSYFVATGGGEAESAGTVAPPTPQVISNVSPVVAPAPIEERSVVTSRPASPTEVKERTRQVAPPARVVRRQEPGGTVTEKPRQEVELRLDKTPENSVRHQPRITPQEGE